jgi:hypothetical protein
MSRLELAALAYVQAEILYHEACQRDRARGVYDPGTAPLRVGTEAFEASKRIDAVRHNFFKLAGERIARMRGGVFDVHAHIVKGTGTG